MIGIWVGIIIFAIAGIIGALIAATAVHSKAGKIGGAIACIVIAGSICFGLHWILYSTEGGKRMQKTFKSNTDGGLYRVVKVYDMEGDQIAEYKGQFDVEEHQTEGVTKIKFDLNGKRHIIYSSTGTVIIDEIPKGGESDND